MQNYLHELSLALSLTLHAVGDGSLANLDDYESVWLVVSSHGDWDTYVKEDVRPSPHTSLPAGDTSKLDYVYSFDSLITVNTLTETLTARKYSKLAGKPIIIILQARMYYLYF